MSGDRSRMTVDRARPRPTSYANERPDPKQAGQAYGDIANIPQQVVEIGIGMMGSGSMGMRGGAPGRPMLR